MDAVSGVDGLGRMHVSMHLRRLWRYAATSVIATAVSEATIVVVYATGMLGASRAAVVASLAGAVPSYVMSRHWIWPEGDRRHAGRQVTAYVAIAVASLAIASVLTGLAAARVPGGRAIHDAVVAVTYLGTYGLLWAGKFVLYQRVLFRPPRAKSSPATAISPVHMSAPVTPTVHRPVVPVSAMQKPPVPTSPGHAPGRRNGASADQVRVSVGCAPTTSMNEAATETAQPDGAAGARYATSMTAVDALPGV